MRLTQVRVRNFRGIKDLTVDLGDTTVLIGENNTGKTAFLEAVRLCLERLSGRGRGPFAEYDYHLTSSTSTPATAEPIKINLVFGESESTPWGEQIDVDLSDVIVLDGDDPRIELLVTSSWDPAISEFRTDWDFLDINGDRMSNSFLALRGLKRLAPTFYLSALRGRFEAFHFQGAVLADVSRRGGRTGRRPGGPGDAIGLVELASHRSQPATARASRLS